MAIDRHGIGPRFSQAVRHGDTIYLAGQISSAETVALQTRSVLEKIDSILSECGSDKSHLLSVTIFLADLTKYDEMNSVWEAWMDRMNPPARATVQAIAHGAQLEIVAIAARRADASP